MEHFTDKNKIQFEEWLRTYLMSDENGTLIYTDSFGNNSAEIERFYEFKPEMQKGVIEVYYDSLGVHIAVDRHNDEIDGVRYWKAKVGRLFYTIMKKESRNEAFEVALIEANKLINKTL